MGNFSVRTSFLGKSMTILVCMVLGGLAKIGASILILVFSGFWLFYDSDLFKPSRSLFKLQDIS